MQFKIDNYDEDSDTKKLVIEPWDGNSSIVDLRKSDTMEIICSLSVDEVYRIFKLLDEKRREELT